MNNHHHGKRHRALTLSCLVLAGESIFIPPFHLNRYFKSSLLDAFGLDELELGKLFAVYGVSAMACYFLGGPLADRFSPRKLLPASLIATGMGSVYMSTIPSLDGLYALYTFWGVSTIFAFWAPLIRATREWGGEDRQGRGFGILDGGRGLVAAVLASGAAYTFTAIVGDAASPDVARETTAVRTLLYAYTGVCIVAAVCIWYFVPDPEPVTTPDADDTRRNRSSGLTRLKLVLSSPAVWLQAVVIVAAYSAFKMFDYYGLYSEDAYGLSRTGSAKLTANLSYIRVGATLAAGWIADRFTGITRAVAGCFGLLIASYGAFLYVEPSRDLVWLMTANMALSGIAFFALRGIYFALLEESRTSRHLTGTAVGVICFVGFTPEIFMPPMTGWLIARAREGGDVLTGYNQIFGILIGLTALGLAAAVMLLRRLGSRRDHTTVRSGR